MEWETVTIEEAQILKIFYELLEEVSYDWAYALGESPREWVVCIYKKDGVWREYMITDGKRIDFNTNEENVYNLCLNNLYCAGGNDNSKSAYLTNAFSQEVALLKGRQNKR